MDSDEWDGDSFTQYRIVVTREGSSWMATAYGGDLSDSGVSARSVTFAGLHDAIRPRLHEHLAGSFSYSEEWSYDLPLTRSAGIEAYQDAGVTLRQAQDEHAEEGRRIVSCLAAEHHASVADIAAILNLSYLQAARLLADRPVPHMGFAVVSARHYWLRDVPRWLGHAAGQQVRTLRVIASDRLQASRG